jgi:transmembrane sensor
MDKKDTLYARIISGELSQEEIIALKKSGEWDQIRAILQFTDGIKAPAFDKDNAYQRLIKSRNLRKQNKPRQLKHYLALSGIAASIILAIGLVWMLQLRPTTISSPLAENKTFLFTDSSRVILNDGSSIKFNKNKWTKKREVELEGEAFFEVEKGRPFIVSTPLGTVKVLGTSFNVRSWGEIFTVTCFTGKVSISNEHGLERIIGKGQSVQFVSGQIHQSTIPNQGPNWLEGISRFDAENLDFVFDEIERQFDVAINAPDLNKTFTGSFTHQSLEEALNQVCKPMGLIFSISKNRKKISISN